MKNLQVGPLLRMLSITSIGLLIISACQMKSPQSQESKSSEVAPAPSLPDQILSVDYLMGHFEPSEHPEFSKIDIKYADREGLYMHKQAYQAFAKMWTDAQTSGITLTIKSAARNFIYQKGIWERKWTGTTILEGGVNATTIANAEDRALKILLYSSMPGSSRHHWGTDIDLNSFDNEYFAAGEGKKVYDWLLAHGDDYGFCQPYTSKADGRTGYEEERWHWSYLPISQPLTQYAAEHLTNDMIKGFQGAETAIDIDVVGRYVLGIDPSCK